MPSSNVLCITWNILSTGRVVLKMPSPKTHTEFSLFWILLFKIDSWLDLMILEVYSNLNDFKILLVNIAHAITELYAQ